MREPMELKEFVVDLAGEEKMRERNREMLELFAETYGSRGAPREPVLWPVRPLRGLGGLSLSATVAAHAAAAARIDLSTIPTAPYPERKRLRGESQIIAYLDDDAWFSGDSRGAASPEDVLALGRQCGKSTLVADRFRADLLRSLVGSSPAARYLTVPVLYRGLGPTPRRA